jgi:hypothetical protein
MVHWFVMPRTALYIAQILAWSNAHKARTSQWPKLNSGPVLDASLGENWLSIDNALRQGLRGLRGGSSLARLLAQYRRIRNHRGLPPLSEDWIVAWAVAHHERTGEWPTRESGRVRGERGETWKGVDVALNLGGRGLSGGSSLPMLLADRLGVRNRSRLTPLTVEQVLAWADCHHRRTGWWPGQESGPIPEAPGENWMAVDMALGKGCRGFPGCDFLARLLKRHRLVSRS